MGTMVAGMAATIVVLAGKGRARQKKKNNSQQSSGSWQERTQWTAPLVASPPSWFSTSFASAVESAFVGAVRDQTERTTSSWVSGALDTLTSVVRRAVTPPSGGQMTATPTTNIQAHANAGDTMGKPIAETPRKPELPEGDALVTRRLIDELKKETAPFPRTCDEKMKRTGGSDMSEMSCSHFASNHRKKKNKRLGSAEAEVTTNPELHELRRLVQSQAAQIKILQDQLYQSWANQAQQEEPELLELVTAEHHRAFMTEMESPMVEGTGRHRCRSARGHPKRDRTSPLALFRLDSPRVTALSETLVWGRWNLLTASGRRHYTDTLSPEVR